MAQLIQLADGVMNRMEIEVSRDVIGVLIVCGMLHRAEVVDLHSSWHNHHAAGMLAGSALDAGTSRRQSGLLSPVHHSTLCFRRISLQSRYRFSPPPWQWFRL